MRKEIYDLQTGHLTLSKAKISQRKLIYFDKILLIEFDENYFFLKNQFYLIFTTCIQIRHDLKKSSGMPRPNS